MWQQKILNLGYFNNFQQLCEALGLSRGQRALGKLTQSERKSELQKVKAKAFWEQALVLLGPCCREGEKSL